MLNKKIVVGAQCVARAPDGLISKATYRTKMLRVSGRLIIAPTFRFCQIESEKKLYNFNCSLHTANC